jgi:hypothetical protein
VLGPLHSRIRSHRSTCGLELDRLAERLRGLLVQELAIPNAAAHELRPLRHCKAGGEWFREQAPEPWLMPEEIVSDRMRCSPIPARSFLISARSWSHESVFFRSSTRRKLVVISKPEKNPCDSANFATREFPIAVARDRQLMAESMSTRLRQEADLRR